jgi:hypothetical protein
MEVKGESAPLVVGGRCVLLLAYGAFFTADYADYGITQITRIEAPGHYHLDNVQER